MNQELKEQAHKEFDERFVEMHPMNGQDMHNAPIFYHIKFKDLDKVKSFIDSIIDRTVQATNERVVGIIENIHTKHYIPEHFNPIENREHLGYRKAQMDIKNSLITNKSDINKDTL